MSDIKPIQTRYKGYHFRSRLEARWAVFFDALGLNWEYEPEGYQTSEGWYLPDFYLPKFDCFVEIKSKLHEQIPCFFAGPINCNNDYRRKLDLSMLSISNVGTSACDHESRKKETVEENLNLISYSKILIAYFDTIDTPGTILEIGYARAIGKQIITFISEDLISLDFDCYNRGPLWYIEDASSEVYPFSNVSDIQLKLKDIFDLPPDIKKPIALNRLIDKPVLILAGAPDDDMHRLFGWNKWISNGWYNVPFLEPNSEVFKAVGAFKSARFEHGQNGA